MCRSRLSLTKIAHQMWWAKETWKQKEQWKWGWRWQGSWGWWKTLQKGGIGNIRGFSWNKGVSTPLSTMSRDLFPSFHYKPPPTPTPPHTFLAFPPFLVKTYHPPAPHYSHFWKISSPRFYERRGGGMGRFKLRRLWMDVIHCLYHSKYYFIFTFLEICRGIMETL